MNNPNRRSVVYTEYGHKGNKGHCLLVTGGMMSPPIAIVERHDGTVTQIPITDIQFVDVAIRWKSESKVTP